MWCKGVGAFFLTIGLTGPEKGLLEHHALMCSTGNKNPETDIGIQSEDQRSKAARHWLLPLPHIENGEILSP